jgi:16S rRNA (guanine527-N7)-methyltransferase
MMDDQIRRRLSAIHPLSDGVCERLEIFVDRLTQWQRKTNLIAPSTLEDIWDRHIADSLQCLAIKPESNSFLDIGSGGGFPGLVIAACIADDPDASITLIESNNKKTAFLRQVNRHMGAGAKVITARIEEADLGSDSPNIITARALASLSTLFELSHAWLQSGTVALFHKGREFEAELEECNGVWEFDLIQHPSRISVDSVILEISNLSRKTG